VTTWYDCYAQQQLQHACAEKKMLEWLTSAFEAWFGVKTIEIDMRERSLYVTSELELLDDVKGFLTACGLDHLYVQEQGMPPGTWRHIV